MFVLSSKYQKAVSEKKALSLSVNELTAEINVLQASNDQLCHEVNSSKAQMSQAEYERAIVISMLESLQQVEGIRESVLASFQKIEEQSQSIQDINHLFDMSSSSLVNIASNMNGLGDKMSGMTTNITGLSDKADYINKFVSTITSISDQTNLLALNAAIEAARAGDAGRGFSVVADEVRSLANETNKSASEVADLVGGIISSTKGAVESVDDIRENNTSLALGVEKLNQDYQSIVGCCDTMKETISSSAHRSFIQTVKLDHIVWKSEVYAVIYGISHKSIHDFADHQMCRLGKWYQSTGRQDFANHHAYQRLDAPHIEVHKCGVDALNLIVSGQKEEATKVLQRMEKASIEVMSILDQLAEL